MATTPQEATAAGLGWVDPNHPLYGTPGYVGAQTAAPGAVAAGPLVPPPPGGPVAPGPGAISAQAGNASTYSQTPGAAPAANTANQGAQDVVRNSYLAQATQGTAVGRDDPAVRAQSEAFRYNTEREKNAYLDDQAERLSAQGLGQSGAMDQERRYASERAGQSAGAFESQLVARELENRRAEIKDALTNLRGVISGDQAMALQRELSELDAALKREGLAQSGSLGSQELSLKDRLGTGALNIDLMRALLQNQQFGTDAGIRIGDLESNAYLRSLGL